MRNVGGFKLTMWGNKLACDPYCRLDGVGGASSWCPQCRDVAQHWLLSSNNIPPCPLNSKQCKKYCDTVSEHSFEKCVICLKVEQDLAAQIQYFLCPNGPERYLIDQQIFCIFLHKSKSCTRIVPRNVHREIWRWKQKNGFHKTVTFAFVAIFIWFQALGLDRNISLAVAPLQ